MERIYKIGVFVVLAGIFSYLGYFRQVQSLHEPKKLVDIAGAVAAKAEMQEINRLADGLYRQFNAQKQWKALKEYLGTEAIAKHWA